MLSAGALNSGMGHTHINKMLAAMNIPTISWGVYKRHEDEVGQAAEAMAAVSCERVLRLEKELTVQNIDKIIELL